MSTVGECVCGLSEWVGMAESGVRFKKTNFCLIHIQNICSCRGSNAIACNKRHSFHVRRRSKNIPSHSHTHAANTTTAATTTTTICSTDLDYHPSPRAVLCKGVEPQRDITAGTSAEPLVKAVLVPIEGHIKCNFERNITK